ncbi:MAG: hypothetical protein AAGG01_23930, partial [Planctomycetota bacterium]
MNEAHLREDEADDLPPIEHDEELDGARMSRGMESGSMADGFPNGTSAAPPAEMATGMTPRASAEERPWNAAGACVLRATDA